jgi:hypothetical protein
VTLQLTIFLDTQPSTSYSCSVNISEELNAQLNKRESGRINAAAESTAGAQEAWEGKGLFMDLIA